MKQQLPKAIKSFLICIALFFTMGHVITYAQTQDGLEVTIETNKESYQTDEQIEPIVNVTNHNTYVVENIEFTFTLPDDIKSTNSLLPIKIEQLQPGEAKRYGLGSLTYTRSKTDVTIDTSAPSSQQTSEVGTGDSSDSILYLGIMIATGSILYVFSKKKERRNTILIPILLFGIGMGAQTTVHAQTIKKTMEVSYRLPYANDDKTLFALVSYEFEEQQLPDKPNDLSSVTKEEWIHALVEKMGIQYEITAPYSFDDFDQAKYADQIEVAHQNGIIDLEADEDNMVFFHPQEKATREFLSYTSIRALQYTTANIDPLDCIDKDSLLYPEEDAYAVKIKLLDLVDTSFLPNQFATKSEMEQVLTTIDTILNETKIDMNHKNQVTFKKGITETVLSYTLDEPNKRITIVDSSSIGNWKKDDIQVLKSDDGSQKDIAIRIKKIEILDGLTIISYEQPELQEVIESFNMEGVTNKDGTLELAEGVTLLDEQTPMTRGTASGNISLFGKKSISINIGDYSASGSIDVQNLEYRFVANPSWHIINIEEVYFALNTAVDLDVSASFEKENPEKKDITVARFSCPIGYGFYASGKINFVTSASGEVSVGIEITNKTGIQYTDERGIRPVFALDTQFKDISLSAELKAGIEIEPSGDFLGIELVSVGAELGSQLSGEINNAVPDPFQFCMDASLTAYMNLTAQIGPDDFNITIEKQLINEKNSPYKANIHIEETGILEECSKGAGNYGGVIKRADQPDQAIAKAKVQIVKNSKIVDTTYSDEEGKFVGVNLSSGDYKVRVSASGFSPYEKTFKIIGGDTTYLEPQLMIARGNDTQVYSYSGIITDAYTAGQVANAKVEIKSLSLTSDGNTLSTVYSDVNGAYNIQLPAGNYQLIIQKDGYVDGTEFIAIASDSTSHSIVLNPSNQITMSGAWRAVLTWGESPSDLDSHLIGTTNNDRFHVYFANKYSEDSQLDVDDIFSYGPETITSKGDETTYYEYYVHNYSHGGSLDSSTLSLSSAQVKIYMGNTLVYTISIPTNQKGTLWHVFDYDAKSGQLKLVNEFSYQRRASLVGSNNQRAAGLPSDDKSILLKEQSQPTPEVPTQETLIPKAPLVPSNTEAKEPTKVEEESVLTEKETQTNIPEAPLVQPSPSNTKAKEPTQVKDSSVLTKKETEAKEGNEKTKEAQPDSLQVPSN